MNSSKDEQRGAGLDLLTWAT